MKRTAHDGDAGLVRSPAARADDRDAPPPWWDEDLAVAAHDAEDQVTQLSMHFCVAALGVAEAGAYACDGQDAGHQLVCSAALLGAKLRRIAGADGDDPHLVPILLLLERARAEVDACARRLLPYVGARARGRFEAARAPVWAVLERWLARIPPDARAELLGLASAGRAPSPFCRLAA
jgi:hypothetical protein